MFPIAIVSVSGEETERIPQYWGDQAVVQHVADDLRAAGFVCNLLDVSTPSELQELKGRGYLVFPNARYFRHPLRYLADVFDGWGQAYVGCDKQGHAMERKSRMKRALLRHGFSTPAFRTIEGLQDIGSLVELPTPHVLKPDAGTESMGVVRVDELGGSMAAVELLANQYGWPILVETWSRAREFTVAVLGNKAARRAFPTEVIVPPPYSYLTAEAKRQGALATTVPIYEQDLHERVSSLAISVADRLGLRDCVRMEILLDRTGDLSVIDVNTLPGLRPGPEHQSYLLSCLAANLGFNQSETVLIIIAAAARRNGLPITSVLGDVWCRLDEGRRVHLDESSPH